MDYLDREKTDSEHPPGLKTESTKHMADHHAEKFGLYRPTPLDRGLNADIQLSEDQHPDGIDLASNFMDIETPMTFLCKVSTYIDP